MAGSQGIVVDNRKQRKTSSPRPSNLKPRNVPPPRLPVSWLGIIKKKESEGVNNRKLKESAPPFLCRGKDKKWRLAILVQGTTCILQGRRQPVITTSADRSRNPARLVSALEILPFRSNCIVAKSPKRTKAPFARGACIKTLRVRIRHRGQVKLAFASRRHATTATGTTPKAAFDARPTNPVPSTTAGPGGKVFAALMFRRRLSQKHLHRRRPARLSGWMLTSACLSRSKGTNDRGLRLSRNATKRLRCIHKHAVPGRISRHRRRLLVTVLRRCSLNKGSVQRLRR